MRGAISKSGGIFLLRPLFYRLKSLTAAQAQSHGRSCVCIATSCFQHSPRIPELECQAILSPRYSLFGGSGTEPHESTKADLVHLDGGVPHTSCAVHRSRFREPTCR